MSKEEDGLVGIVEMGGGNQPPLPREHPEAKFQQHGHQVTPGSRSDRDRTISFPIASLYEDILHANKKTY